MPGTRRHRGPHPQDRQLFPSEALPDLRRAVADLSWLRTRGYADPSALKLVGDRYRLRARQRAAVGRCACSDSALTSRAGRMVKPAAVRDRALVIDGLNVLTTIEVALSGGVLLQGRDGCIRDMASVQGTYRLVVESEGAVTALIALLDELHPGSTRIYIDRPVSNSGRLAALLRTASESSDTDIEIELADRVDETLIASDAVVATADSAILDRCDPWLNLARLAVERVADEADSLWILDLAGVGA